MKEKLKLWFRKIRVFVLKYKLLTFIPIAFLTYQNYVLRANHIELEKKVVSLEKENLRLLSDMVIFNRSYEDFPYPVWQKVKRGSRFIFQYCNPAYEEMYLRPFGFSRYDYMGKTDFDIHQAVDAELYYKRDFEMAVKGGFQRFDETQTDTLGNVDMLDALKWRHIERKDTLIYGMIIPEKKK